jgi:hypothetical protein
VAVIALLAITLKDELLERVRSNMARAIAELQQLPLSRARVLTGIALLNGVSTPIAHGLGRPVTVLVSPVRGATSTGLVEEIRDGSHDRSKYVVLKASGYATTVTVDLVVL